MVGLSSSRKAGSFSKFCCSAARRVAVISAVRPVSRTQRTTSCLLFSSDSTTRSESTMNCSIVWFWSPRMRSVLVVSRRPGWARRSTVCRSCGRPARPAPSDETISRSRSRYGVRRTLLTRSCGTVEVVFFTGITPLPSLGIFFLLLSPGWQSTKYSPISDWGLMSQLAFS